MSLDSVSKQLNAGANAIKENNLTIIDNPREVIDPHVRTKAISIQQGTIQQAPSTGYDIANKAYVDAAAAAGGTPGLVSGATIGFYIGSTKVGSLDVNGDLKIKGQIITNEASP